LRLPAAHGSVTVSPDGSFQYTAAAGFVGTDSFVYKAIDVDANGQAFEF
jgi:hypothetical protein